jgi:hypothetical protein
VGGILAQDMAAKKHYKSWPQICYKSELTNFRSTQQFLAHFLEFEKKNLSDK